jgi:hypothetical protein
MYEAGMTRLVLYATLGLLLDALGQDVSAWGFWCILGLFMCSDYLVRKDGYESGVAAGIAVYSSATEEQRTQLDKIVKDND